MIYKFEPRQVHPVPLRESVADAMRRAIVLGELDGGQRLDEQALADKFGVSRIPIREAFALLQRDGLVQIVPRRGTFVIGLTDNDIHDIYEFRRTIEVFAVRRIAQTIDAEGIAQLARLAVGTETAMEENQSDRMAEDDLAFHRQLVTLGGNKRAIAAWETIAGLISVFLGINSRMFRKMILTFDPVAEHRHTKLLRLIESHDVEGADALLQQHLLDSEMVIREAMKHIRSRDGTLSGETLPPGNHPSA